MQNLLLTQKIRIDKSSQWIATLLFCWTPLLLLESDRGLSTVEIIIACAFAIILLIWILKPIILKKPLYLRPLDVSMILFFSFIFVYLVRVIDGSIYFEDWLKWRKFLFLLIYFPISTQFNNVYRLRALIYSLLCVGLLIALYDIITISSQSSLFGDYFFNRLVSNTFPIWVSIFSLGMIRHFIFKDLQINTKLKILTIVSFVVCTVSSVAFARRTPLVLIFISIIISILFFIKYDRKFYIHIYKKALISIISIFILIITLVLLFPDARNFITKGYEQYKYRLKIQEVENAYIGRASRYEEAWNIFLKNPLFGSGKADEINYYDFRYREMRKGSIHSLYLYFLAKTGIIGAILFFYLIFKSIQFSLRTVHSNLTREMRMYAEGATIAIITMLISGFSSTRILAIESFLFFGICLGVLTNIWKYTHGR